MAPALSNAVFLLNLESTMCILLPLVAIRPAPMSAVLFSKLVWLIVRVEFDVKTVADRDPSVPMFDVIDDSWITRSEL